MHRWFYQEDGPWSCKKKSFRSPEILVNSSYTVETRRFGAQSDHSSIDSPKKKRGSD